MSRFILIVFTLVTAILISCNSSGKSDAELEAHILALNTSDTFLFEPNYPKWQPDSTFRKKKLKFEKMLGLNYLEKGFDSIQIRIIYGCVIGNQRIIVLCNRGNAWSAEISALETYMNPGFDENTMDFYENILYRRKITYKTPKSGWNSFIGNLFSLNILTLPESENLTDFKKNKPSINDGCGIDIEVATKNVYRYYGYPDPDLLVKIYPEAQDVIKIATLLNKEFGIKDWPTDRPVHSEERRDTISPNKIKTQEINLEDLKQN